jgi:hypothetical protein
MPRKVLGPQDDKTHGNPHIVTRKVAKRKECANGAMTMVQLNIQCPQIHAVRRSGLYLLTFVAIAAIAAGGLCVKLVSSGDLMSIGRIQAPIKVTKENSTREKLPILPISPSASFDALKSWGASYLK